MRNKMITLCPTTYETAQKIPNFSAWVRNRLRDLEDYTPKTTSFCYIYKCPICKTSETSLKRHARTCEKCVYVMDFVKEAELGE